MSDTIRFGLIGGGLMGREFASAIARWLHLVDFPVKAQLVAVSALEQQQLDWYARMVPGIQTTRDYKQLLANPSVDAVYCAVPHNLHAQLYCDTLDAGKHLLGEKPFGMDLTQSRQINAAIARHPQLVVRCSSEFPFFPAMQRFIRYIKENRFGQIIEVEAGFLHASDLDPLKPINWKRMVAINGEYGVMGDLGIHAFHVPLRFGWQPRNVRAILSKIVTQRPDGKGGMVPCETWDNAALFCQVGEGTAQFPMTIKLQRIAPGETNTWYLSVKGTSFCCRFTTRYPRSLQTLSYVRGQPQNWCEEAIGAADSLYPSATGGIFETGFSDSIQQMVAAFADQVRSGPAGSVPFSCVLPQEAAQTHVIFTAALRSQKTAQTIDLRDGHGQ